MKSIQFVRSTVVLFVLSACAVTLTRSNQTIRIKIKRNSSGTDSPHHSHHRKTSNETRAENSAPRKIEIDSNRLHSNNSNNSNSNDTHKIETVSKTEIDSNRPHSNNSNNSNNARKEIETDNKKKIDSNRPHNSNNSNSNGHSNNASRMIAVSSKFKIESNSELSNNERKMTISAGRDSSANGTSTCVRVQTRSRGMFGSNIGHALGILSTAAGSSEAATAAIAFPTTATADPLAVVTTSEFTGNR